MPNIAIVFNSEEEAREYLTKNNIPAKNQRISKRKSNVILSVDSETNEHVDFFSFADYIIEKYNTADEMTKKNYRRHLQRFEKSEILSGLHITDIEKIHGERLLTWLARKGVKDKPASYETVKGALTVLKMIVSRAYENDYIEKDVFKKLSLPNCVVKKKPRKTVSDETWNKVARGTKGDSVLYAYILLLRTTGMRPAEARALAWKNVDFKRKEINVCEAVKHKQEGEDGIGSTKTGVERVNLLTDESAKALKKLKNKHNRIFTNPDGSLITEYAFSNRLRKMLSKLAEFEIIEKDEIFSAYNLRHTYITDLMKRGFTSSQVALLVGNSAEITDRTYNHSTSRDVMELLKNTQKQGQRTNGSEKTCRQRTKKGVDNSP